MESAPAGGQGINQAPINPNNPPLGFVTDSIMGWLRARNGIRVHRPAA